METLTYPRSWLECVDRPGLKPLGYIAKPHLWGFGSTCMDEKAPLMGRRTIALPVGACPLPEFILAEAGASSERSRRGGVVVVVY